MTVHPALHARRICQIISASRIDLTTEAAAHQAIEKALIDAGVEYTSEVRLSPKDRIDILSGRVGVEVKVGHQKRAIYSQLKRYAASDQIDALVLATGRAFPKGVSDIDGTPLLIADLTRGWL